MQIMSVCIIISIKPHLGKINSQIKSLTYRARLCKIIWSLCSWIHANIFCRSNPSRMLDFIFEKWLYFLPGEWVNALFVSRHATILARSPFDDLCTCRPDRLKTERLLSKFVINSHVTPSEWQILSIDFRVALGPSILIASLTNLFLNSRSKSSGMFPPTPRLFLTVLFHTKRWASWGLRSAYTWNNKYNASRAYFLQIHLASSDT